MTAQEEAHIYTDGSCKGNPGPGGWAWVQLNGGHEVLSRSGGAANTTNNRMELQALLAVLEHFPKQLPLHVFTDSTYVASGVTKWMPNWKRKGWVRHDNKPVANADLWRRVDELTDQRALRFSWVKGHAKTHGNELADDYANLAADRAAKEVA